MYLFSGSSTTACQWASFLGFAMSALALADAWRKIS